MKSPCGTPCADGEDVLRLIFETVFAFLGVLRVLSEEISLLSVGLVSLGACVRPSVRPSALS